MFGFGVKHGVFGNTNGTCAITHERYMRTLLTKVTQLVCDPKQLWAKTSSSNILSFYGRLGYTRLFVRRLRNKRRTQKLTSTQSRFSINSTPRKVDIQKTKKWKGRGHWIPKTKLRSVSKIPEDPASLPSSTRGRRSSSSTSSGPWVLHPHLRVDGVFWCT
jgi:hypothetical protein